MLYRKELDGLRAVAVVPVVLFHAGMDVVSGGFLGVDIFFVISGYLITSILIEDLERGRFSLLHFYERRARRILPALIVVLVFSLICAWIWIFPRELMYFSRSLISVLFFYSNFHFLQNTGYFSPDAELQPLLHTWSLAVEEQFYLVFPLLLAFLWRFGRNKAVAALALLGLISLLACKWASGAHPEANFFLAPTRAWQLLAGSLSAFYLSRQPVRSSNLLSLVGLLAIAYSLFFFDRSMPLPSALSLLPVGGACLIILFAGRETLVARLLSQPPVVGIGMISYSVYLWHQPLLSFAYIRNPYDPELWVLYSLGLLSFAMGYLSWRFVEQPFRGHPAPLLKGRRQVFVASLAAVACLSALAGVTIGLKGAKWRFGGETARVLSAEKDRSRNHTKCMLFEDVFRDGKVADYPLPDCTFPSDSKAIDVAILGDSHAEALAGALSEQLNAAGYSTTQVTVAACAPWVGITKCRDSTRYMNNGVLASDTPIVVLSARYAMSISGLSFDNGVGGAEKKPVEQAEFSNAVCLEKTAECRKLNAYNAFRSEIELLVSHGKKVILVYPIPEGGWHVPRAFARLRAMGETKPLSYPRSIFEARNGPVSDFLDSLDIPGLYRVKPVRIFCEDMVTGECVQARGDDIYYFDDDHLSHNGASLVSEPIVSIVRDLLPAQARP
ncbi:acyltransferase family protein [uncultured Cohaesibacter sp.]|uniref:acyltransferase family protein n=1 Tax=uncultured Cohaesibacter sp. TaxID=1002546 RepID=UPI0029C70859|nr:acyltransferase family protein [uncultured Cohaesibacter sp.]